MIKLLTQLKHFINSSLPVSAFKYLLLLLFSGLIFAETMNIIDIKKFPPEINARTDADKHYTSITHKGQIYNIKMGTLTGAEPGTYLYTHFLVNTKGGGKFTFKYRLQSYDDNHGGDYANIAIMEPGSTQKTYLVQYLRSTHPESGTLYDSGYKTITLDMDKWKYKEAKYDLEFYLTLDGQGDNTLLEISDMQALGCDVWPIVQITDPDSMRFENQETDGVDQLNESTAAGLQCMQASAKALKANFRLSAAYRPIQYQLHLLSVWNAYILKDINQPPQYCTTLQQQGAKEKQYHHIVYPPASTPSAPHVRGNAIDAKITKLPAPYTIDTFANSCKMDRRVPEDKIHFEPIHVKWNTDTLTSWFSN